MNEQLNEPRAALPEGCLELGPQVATEMVLWQ